MERYLHSLTGHVRRFDAARPWVADAALAAVLFTGGMFDRSPHEPQLGIFRNLMLIAALTLPLVMRRRYPSTVFAIVAAATTVQAAVGNSSVGGISLFIALYGVALRESSRRIVAAMIAAELVQVPVFWHISPQSYVPTVVAMTIATVGAASLGYAIRSRRNVMLALRERAEQLQREQAADTALAVAAERANMAREVHDVIAHNISVMVALADGASYAIETNPESARLALSSIGSTGRDAVRELQHLLTADDPSAVELLPQPGLSDLPTMIDRIRSAGLPVTVNMTGPVNEESRGVQLAIYRIVQEALTNALKHSRPGSNASAVVTVGISAESIELDVINTGTGHVPGPGSRHGIIGMRERAARHNGSLDAGLIGGDRWRVRCTLASSRVGSQV